MRFNEHFAMRKLIGTKLKDYIRSNGFSKVSFCMKTEISRTTLDKILNDVLYFYYNNREVRFSLTECKCIYNKQKQNAWKNPVNGMDASFLKAKDNAQKNRKAGVNCQTESQGLRATATVEGDLTITSGNEVQAILARGVCGFSAPR